MANSRLGLRTRPGGVVAYTQTTQGPEPVDPDAAAFIAAAGITNATQQAAINKLVVDLKNNALWTKMKALYPFVGGTATTHKFNLKDPRDLDAAYRIIFNGGWTHSSDGITGNGSNGYADTKFNVSTALTSNTNNHCSLYSRTNNNSGRDCGVSNGVTYSYVLLAIRGNFAGTDTFEAQNGDHNMSVSNTVGTGFYMLTSTASTAAAIYKNGSSVATSTATQTRALLNLNWWIGGLNINNSLFNPSTKQYAFASIGDSLSASDASTFYTIVQAYQTTLGRNV
jgi:hypothetical protein